MLSLVFVKDIPVEMNTLLQTEALLNYLKALFPKVDVTEVMTTSYRVEAVTVSGVFYIRLMVLQKYIQY
jgi:hypothetical protein